MIGRKEKLGTGIVMKASLYDLFFQLLTFMSLIMITSTAFYEKQILYAFDVYDEIETTNNESLQKNNFSNSV